MCVLAAQWGNVVEPKLIRCVAAVIVVVAAAVVAAVAAAAVVLFCVGTYASIVALSVYTRLLNLTAPN